MKQIATLLFVLYIPACTSAQSTYTIAAIDRPTDAAVPVPTISSTVVDGLSSSGQAIVVGNTDRTFMDATVEGLWVGAPGAMQLLAADDTAAPGTDADTYFAVYDVFSFQQQAANWTIGAGGDAVLMAPLQGPNVGTNKFGVWAGKPGALELIAREGGSAPGTAAGSTFTRISEEVAAGLPGPAVNASGQVAFSASVVAASGQSLGGGIWVGRPGSLQMEAGRAGALINDKGEVAYQGTGGIWTGLPGATKLAVPLREPAPGLPGVTNAVVNGQLAFNNAGHVAFYATLSGAVGLTNNLALWLASGAAPTLIARTGSQAPGLDAGIVFADFVKFAGFALGQVPILNDLDQVLFAAQLRGPGVTATNDLSLWLAGNNAGPQLVAREGDLAPGTSSPTARFASVTSPPALNDKGQVAFYALLTGIVASNNVAIYLGKPGDLQILTHSGAAFSTADGYSGHINGISRFYAGLGSPHGGHGAGLSENGGVLLQTSLILQKPFVESRNAVVLVAMGSTTTSDSFRILSVSKTGNDVAILFASSPGKHYTLEYNEQLAAGGWASLAGETAATAAETTITDSSDPKGAHRFYRVRQL